METDHRLAVLHVDLRAVVANWRDLCVRHAKPVGAVLKAAVRTLGALPSDESVEALAWLLKEGPADLRPDALEALGVLARQRRS